MWLTSNDTIRVDRAKAAASRCPCPARAQNSDPNRMKSETRSTTESRKAPARLASPRSLATPPWKISDPWRVAVTLVAPLRSSHSPAGRHAGKSVRLEEAADPLDPGSLLLSPWTPFFSPSELRPTADLRRARGFAAASLCSLLLSPWTPFLLSGWGLRQTRPDREVARGARGRE